MVIYLETRKKREKYNQNDWRGRQEEGEGTHDQNREQEGSECLKGKAVREHCGNM